MAKYHVPVLLTESIEGLHINPDGIYTDVTFGGGGHSRAILARLDNGHLYAFDQDADAVANAPEDDRFTLIESSFEHLRNQLRFHGVAGVDGILADLGVSSHQFDEAGRGFSFRFDEAELDMRMNRAQELSAHTVVNTYSEEKLADVLFLYGELRQSRRMARAIVQHRSTQSIDTVGQLKYAIRDFVPRLHDYKFYAQVFQALRMEVNNELHVLKSLLTQSAEVMKKGGRLVVISYHSLEDRLVKNYMNKGRFEGEAEKDFYGNEIKPFRSVNRKAIVPAPEEMQQNPRSRSAKLRIAERI